MTDQLNTFFACGALLDRCTLAQLEALANEVYMRYMTTQASHNTLAPPTALADTDIHSAILAILGHRHKDSAPAEFSSKISTAPTYPASDQMLGNLYSSCEMLSHTWSLHRPYRKVTLGGLWR